MPHRRVGRLGEGDLLRCIQASVRAEPCHRKRCQSRLALGNNTESVEYIEVFKWSFLVLGKELLPGLAASSVDGNRDDPKVLAGIVHPDVEEAVAMIDRVLLLVYTRRDHEEDSARRLGVEVAALVGGVAAGLHHQVLAVAGLADAEVEAFVPLFVDQGVVSGRISQPVPEEFVLALRDLVFGGVEERMRVCRPHQRPDTLGRIGKLLAGS